MSKWDPAGGSSEVSDVPRQIDSGFRMKAAQWDPAQGKVVVNSVLRPDPDVGQFVIRIASASLCRSDLMSMAMADRKEPITIGHEGAGYIHKMHPSARGKGFEVGDPVGFLYVQNACYECRGCMVHNNHCMKRQSQVNGFSIPGFFAEYAVVDWQNCIKLPESMPPSTAAPMFCAGVTAFHTIDSCELKPGSWLAIVGCGGLGQLAIQYAKAMGAKVIAIDISDGCLADAKTQGADYTFNSLTDKSHVEDILRLTDGGADTVAVYSDAEAAYDGSIPLIRVGGILMVVGLPHTGVKVGALDVARGTYRVKGDSTGIPQRLPKAIEFTTKHGIKPDSEVYSSLEDVNHMVEKMKAGKSSKRMLVALQASPVERTRL